MSRRPFSSPSIRRSLLAVALLLVCGPAWGYIVFLKDGTQIQAKEKYRLEGDKVYLILPSGVEAFYDASKVDFDKTDKINVVDYGTAKLLESMDKPKPVPEDLQTEDLEPSFGEYISGRSLALPEIRKREMKKESTDALPLTTAGFVDLMALRREQYPHADVIEEVLGYLKGQGIDRVRIFQGTAADRPLLEIVAASEASVFKTLKDTASGLQQIHERFPEQVAAFELVMMTDSQERAGQFVLTPELADLLVSGRLKAPGFFLRYVEF